MQNLIIQPTTPEFDSILLKNKNGNSPIAIILYEHDNSFTTPTGSIDFFQYLKDNYEGDIDVYGNADEVNYVELQSVIIDIGMYLITDIAVPTFVSILSSYLYDKFKTSKMDNTELRFVITVDDGKQKVTCQYSGPTKEGIDSLKMVLDTVKSKTQINREFTDNER